MSEPHQPRAVQNGMSPAEYTTWMFLADKKPGAEPYTYTIKQSDLTALIAAHDAEMHARVVAALERLKAKSHWGTRCYVNELDIDAEIAALSQPTARDGKEK